ncbi:MAG: hypothetical protein CYPHOPRED_004876 [Cyphobasidiales sp. Tagirdzhanova-0007]|nr:MAG: hypothetical protein CYPHOPRED_004876 [Cyphobasidiales sp. Tagirdzhanova-0007]
MNAQIATLAIGLALSQGAKRLNLDRPEVLWPIRFLYIGVQVGIFALYMFIAQRIRKKNDNTLLKYVEQKPFSGQTGEPPMVVTTTVRNYDLLEVSKAIRGLATGIAMTGFMHLYLKFTQPLLVSSLTVWISLYRAQIVRLHLRNQEGQEDLKRPFRAGPGWMSSGSGPSTDKVSIEAAEKANLLYRAPET